MREQGTTVDERIELVAVEREHARWTVRLSIPDDMTQASAGSWSASRPASRSYGMTVNVPDEDALRQVIAALSAAADQLANQSGAKREHS